MPTLKYLWAQLPRTELTETSFRPSQGCYDGCKLKQGRHHRLQWNMFSQKFPNLNSYFIWVKNSYPVWLNFKHSISFKSAVSVILWFKTMTWLIFTSDGIKCGCHNQALTSHSGLGKSPNPETFIPPFQLVKPLDRHSLPYLVSHLTLFWGPPLLLHFPRDSLCKPTCFL